MIRLGFDARLYGPEQKGLGRYVEQILFAFKNAKGFQPVIFVLPKNLKEIKNILPKAEIIPVDIRWYTAKEQIIFPNIIKKRNLDLIHYPHFNVPIFASTPFIVTIHDLILLEYPSARATFLGPTKYFIKKTGWKNVLSRALKKAKAIITPSKSVAASIINFFSNIDEERIFPIHLGADAISKTATSDHALEERNILGPFFLYVGNVYPHKNIEWLISVFQSFYWKHPETRLVIAGSDDPFHGRLKQFVKDLNLEEAVYFWGKAADEELAELYANCLAYVFPTRAEGFGIPALEAMEFGAPVIAARLPVLEEILADSALFFSVSNSSGIIELMERLFTDSSLRLEYARRGKEQAKNFFWDKTRQETLSVYRKVVNTL